MMISILNLFVMRIQMNKISKFIEFGFSKGAKLKLPDGLLRLFENTSSDFKTLKKIDTYLNNNTVSATISKIKNDPMILPDKKKALIDALLGKSPAPSSDRDYGVGTTLGGLGIGGALSYYLTQGVENKVLRGLLLGAGTLGSGYLGNLLSNQDSVTPIDQGEQRGY